MIYERGYYEDSSISNYTKYIDKKFDLLAKELLAELNILEGESILDFGCATGGLMKAMKDIKKPLHLQIIGTDISYWAIEYGREAYDLGKAVLQHYNRSLLENGFSYILFLDVLEHIPTSELELLFSIIKSNRIVVRVPVSIEEGEDFFLEISRNDKTHIQIHDKIWWESFLKSHNFFLNDIIERDAIYDSVGVLSRVYKREKKV